MRTPSTRPIAAASAIVALADMPAIHASFEVSARVHTPVTGPVSLTRHRLHPGHFTP